MPRVLTPVVIVLIGLLIALLLAILIIGSTIKKKKNGTIPPTERIVSIKNSSGRFLAINFNPFVRPFSDQTDLTERKIAAFTGRENEPNTQWRIQRIVGGGYQIRSTYIEPTFGLKISSSSEDGLVPFPPNDFQGYCALVPSEEATLFDIVEVELGTQFFTVERQSLFLATKFMSDPEPPSEFDRLYVASTNDLLPETFIVEDSP